MIKIESYLIAGRPDGTRVYDFRDGNGPGLRLTVLKREDLEAIKTARHLKQDAFYILVWPESSDKNDKQRIYIGQTSDGQARMLQHIKMGRLFDDALVFTGLDERLTKTQVMLLEYNCVQRIIDQHDGYLMENSQVPLPPTATVYDRKRSEYTLSAIETLTYHAGYHSIFVDLNTILPMDEECELNEKPKEEKPFGYTSKNKIGDRLSKNESHTERIISASSDSEIYDEGNNMLIRYVVERDDCRATAIIHNDKVMVLPGAIISPDADLDILAQQPETSDIYERVNKETRTLIREVLFDDFSQAALLVSGKKNDSIWKQQMTVLE